MPEIHRPHFSALLALLLAAAGAPLGMPAAEAQQSTGRPITTADIRAWNTVRQNVLSNDGKWFAYVVSPNEGNATVVLRGVSPTAEELRFPAGEGGGQIAISGDSRWMGFIVAPPRQAGGGARAGGAAGGGGGQGAPANGAAPAENASRFVLLNLATGETKEFPRIRRFAFNTDAATWIVLQGAGPGGAAGGGRGGAGPGGGATAGGNADVLLYNIASGQTFNLGRVYEYAFNESGDWLAYTMDTPDQVGNAVQLFNTRTSTIRPVESERVLYRHLAWTDSSRALSVMRGRIDESARDTVFSIAAFTQLGANGPTRTLTFDPAGRQDFPSGWKLASERAPRFSADMSAVYFGIREAARAQNGGGRANGPAAGAPGMGGTINQTAGRGGGAADSLPDLILWHGRDPRLQSQQMVQEQADRTFNYLASFRFRENAFLRLADDELRTVTLTTGERYAYGTDNREYQHEASYSGRNYMDVYKVDLATGARTLLMRKKPSIGQMTSSPDGRSVLYWGEDGHYHVLDMETGASRNITAGVPTSFVNTESDHNNLFPPPIAARGWSSDGSAVLLYDNWDVWRVPVRGGQAVNLTVDGRERQVRYRTLYDFPNGRRSTPGVDLSRPLYFATYGEWTKHEGIARVDPRRPGAQMLFEADARLGITKARDADVYVYTRQTFTEYPNWWAFESGFRPGYRMTDVNPQMAELAWSSGAQLIDYTSDHGDRLQGALYLPAGYEPGRKYPLLVTIYEKRSQNKNGFVSPSDTRAPDPTLYTSRGYAVLDPDIVYRVNDPGMSAVWAVIPAVKAAIATGIVDEANVGLWGHSWGGYQTAFLVTQTNIFKAAIAGAPLTDMVSMYSSVYWNTGGTNQAIFEASQGRFAGNFLDNYEAYIRNSPAYHANKVATPLIIMHNDKDGAVDFNQGITFFNTLRQLGREVILLQYAGENHGLSRPPNQRDYAVRMTEWFDHYLKGAPAPDWMRSGIPRIQLAEHLRERQQAAQQEGNRAEAAAQQQAGPSGP